MMDNYSDKYYLDNYGAYKSVTQAIKNWSGKYQCRTKIYIIKAKVSGYLATHKPKSNKNIVAIINRNGTILIKQAKHRTLKALHKSSR